MIVELFGPPGAGKTTLLRALCLELTRNGIPLKTVNGYRRIDSVVAGKDVESGPEVRHGIDRLIYKLATAGPILLSPLPRGSVAARLLALIPPRSRTWALRQKIDLTLLAQARRTAEASTGVYIFEEGFVQSLCALVMLADGPAIDKVGDCLEFLPRPDLLISVDACDQVLRQRLVARHAHQTFSSRILEVGLERDLKQAGVARQVSDRLRQARWPLLEVDGAGRPDLDQICSRIEGAVAETPASVSASRAGAASLSPARLRALR